MIIVKPGDKKILRQLGMKRENQSSDSDSVGDLIWWLLCIMFDVTFQNQLEATGKKWNNWNWNKSCSPEKMRKRKSEKNQENVNIILF